MRLRTVSTSAGGLDRNAFASVHGKRPLLSPEYGLVPDVGCSQTSASSCGDGILFRRCVDEQVLQLLALGPVVADLAGHLGGVAVAADDEPVERRAIDVAVRADRRRLEQADELGERLLAAVVGVADARISASVFGASTRASALFWVPVPVRLCDSSMTTASHWCLRRWWR